MGKPTTKHSDRLKQLQDAERKERAAERETQLDAQAAQAAAAQARQALVDAHATGKADDVKRAEKAYEQARADADAAAIGAEAAALRQQRAADHANNYEAQHARELIGELQPRAAAAVDRLTETARGLYEAHVEWHQVSAAVGSLIRHVPNAQSSRNAPADHALASVARDLRNFINEGGQVASPMPHWQGVAEHEAEEQRKLSHRLKDRIAKEAAA